ncbi:hypothetical protein HPB51_005341 [Rhipicephalus microplus]|uniref:Uncharacterized protein n=1 Tax=Rhipicephalus microplus TaxID=6941 RepID=A0A9J6EYA2_RHIMP|nr:hypothetical protein HPB51_005341 [Rhipicephalus microplus]
MAAVSFRTARPGRGRFRARARVTPLSHHDSHTDRSRSGAFPIWHLGGVDFAGRWAPHVSSTCAAAATCPPECADRMATTLAAARTGAAPKPLPRGGPRRAFSIKTSLAFLSFFRFCVPPNPLRPAFLFSFAGQFRTVDIIYMDEVLSQEFALMDVAYIYAWKRDSPMRLFFRICKMPPKPSAVKGPPITACSEIKQMVENGTNSSTETEVAKEPAENKPADESRTAMPPPRAPEQENKPAAKTPPAPAGAVLKSVPQPEEPREPAVTAAPATEPSIATIAPAAEHHAPETPEMKTAAEEESTAPGSPKAIALVQSTSPQRQKASEPPAEAQSPPPLPKITISGLDKNSHKILIHTKEVSHTLGPALSPPQNGQDRSSPPYGKKSKRKEQHDIERHHQSKRKSPEKVDKRSQWCQSPQEDGISNKKLKLDGCDDAVEVDRKSISSPLQKSEGSVSISEAARRNMPKAMPILLKPAPPPPPPAHPRTPPYTPIPPSLPRSEKDTQPLDLSVTHRGTVVGVSQDPPRRPRGRPSVPLPSVMPLPLVTKRPSLPQTTTVTTTSYSPPTSVPTFHKMPAVPPTSSHHHHHHHHRGNSKSFRKNANLTCITPDPNAGHTKIVIRNMPPLNTNNNNLHRVCSTGIQGVHTWTESWSVASFLAVLDSPE